MRVCVCARAILRQCDQYEHLCWPSVREEEAGEGECSWASLVMQVGGEGVSEGGGGGDGGGVALVMGTLRDGVGVYCHVYQACSLFFPPLSLPLSPCPLCHSCQSALKEWQIWLSSRQRGMRTERDEGRQGREREGGRGGGEREERETEMEEDEV